MCLAVPGKVLRGEARDGTTMAEVDFGGVLKEVCLEYVPEVQVGEYVIVHVGFAIQRLDEESALETLRSFEQLGILEEEFGDGFTAAARRAGLPHPGPVPEQREQRPAAPRESTTDGEAAT